MDASRFARAPLRHRDFRRYLGCWLLSNLGGQMLGVAVAWQIYSITHRAIDLGYVGLVQFVPAFGLSLVAGSIADRFDRARIVTLSNLAQALCAAALLALARAAPTRVAPIYLVLLFVGFARAFEAPAGQALVPGLVPRDEFPTAVTWTSTVWQFSTIVGPSVGGFLYGVAGGGACPYAAAVLSLIVASALAFAIRSPPVPTGPSEGTWSSALRGIRFVRSNLVIVESITLDLFAVLLGGATALLPIYASDVLHVGPQGLGLLRSAPALGAATMAIVLAHRPLERRAGPTLLASVAIFGAATVIFGLSRSNGLSFGALLITGASDMVSVVVRSTVVQLRTPHEMRGRVSAVSMMCILASSNLGELESGLTAAWLGAVPAVVVGGLGTIVVVAVYALRRGLRSVDRLDPLDGLAHGPTASPGVRAASIGG